MISLAYFILTLAAINRMRGGGCAFFNRLPGHTRLYAAALVAAVSVVWKGPLDGALVGLCFLAWSFPPWGRWYDLGALDDEPNRPETWFEAWIKKFAFGEDAVAFTLRNLVALMPAAILLSPAFVLLAPFITAAYGLGWKLDRARAIRLAEYLTGALWGVFVWALV